MKTKIIITLAVAAILSSCKEKIDLKLDSSASRLVVEGSVTNELKKHTITLSRSTDYFNQGASPKVSGATVSVNDGSCTYQYEEIQAGVYESVEAYAGVPGNTYNLNITIDGNFYTASSTMMHVTTVDSIRLERAYIPIQPGVILDPEKNYYNILIFCQEPGNTADYYMMDAYKNGVLLTDTVTKKGISDDLFFNGSYLNAMKALQIVADKGDTITFRLSNIEKDYVLFLNALHMGTISGSPFAGTPANLSGNISNGAFGYFYAASVSSAINVIK